MPARAAPVRPSGPTAVSSSPPSPEITATASTSKLKRLALKSALSAKAASGDLLVVDNLALDEIKTKSIQAFLDAVSAGKTIVRHPRGQ